MCGQDDRWLLRSDRHPYRHRLAKAYLEALRWVVIGMWKRGSASGKDFYFSRIRLGGGFRSLRVSCVSKNQASFFQISQEARMHLRKEFESPGLVGLHPGDF